MEKKTAIIDRDLIKYVLFALTMTVPITMGIHLWKKACTNTAAALTEKYNTNCTKSKIEEL